MDWLKTNSARGWTNILKKLEAEVVRAIEISPENKVDLIGHSSCGIILRLYLSDNEFEGKIYDGKRFTSNLITLGSPHQAKRATKLRRFVDNEYPGNFFKEVNYISVGGKIKLNSKKTSLITKVIAEKSYKSISGSKCSDGDGLVPLSSSLLKGSQHIIVKDAAHGGFFGKHWYCETSIIDSWWKKIKWQ